MSMRTIIAALALFALPVAASGQPGMGYHDGAGVPLLFAQIDIPIYDQTGRLLVDLRTEEPITNQLCVTVPIDNVTQDFRHAEFAHGGSRDWLRSVSYTIDMAHRQVVVHHVWVLRAIAIPESPGYKLINFPSEVDYAIHIAQRFINYRPLTSQCNWDDLLAHLVVTRRVPKGGGGGGDQGPWLPPEACFPPSMTGCTGNLPRGFNCWTDTSGVRHCL
jgi:hypothetical protein